MLLLNYYYLVPHALAAKDDFAHATRIVLGIILPDGTGLYLLEARRINSSKRFF